MAERKRRNTTHTSDVEEAYVATVVATEDSPDEDIVEVRAEPEPATPFDPPRVTILNRALSVVYVDVRSGTLRLGPKESVSILDTDVTEATRRLEAEGRIFIRNQTQECSTNA